VLEFGDAQVTANSEVDQRGRDVDWVDALIGDGAHQTGAHTLARLEYRFPVAHGAERPDGRDLTREDEIRTGAAMQPPQQQRTNHQGGQRRARRCEVHRERPVEVPLLVDPGRRRDLIGAETDGEGHLLACAPRRRFELRGR
jgi:hypothetical protein